MRMLTFVMLLLGVLAGAETAQAGGQRFVSIAFHDVADEVGGLDADAVTSKVLVQFFDWLKGSGWTAVSLDDLAAAAGGSRQLPEKAILITFDDGYRSLYSRVFPLLKVYRYPIVAALVGSWMENRPDGKVLYGDRLVPRGNFISWAEAREMQASGFVEFASHSYDLHHGVQANPQGNVVPASVTWRYDPATQTYEDDTRFRARIRADLTRARQMMTVNLGHGPRALVWPFGRYSGPALDVAKETGFRFALTLEPEPADTSSLYAIHRYFPSANPNLGDLARNLRFEPGAPTTRRIACITLDALADKPAGPAQDDALGRMIEDLRRLGANTVVIDANAALARPDAPLGTVYFPTRLRPLRADLLSRATWQIRTRGGADVYLRLPLAAATAALGPAAVPDLFADMMRQTTPDGLVIDLQPSRLFGGVIDDQPGEIRARRRAFDATGSDGWTQLAMASYRAAAFIDPRQRLMLAMREPGPPPDWADIALLPPMPDETQTTALARRFRMEGWLRPKAASRVAFTLPPAPERQVEALRQAQRLGASVFAYCPFGSAPIRPELSGAFSAATYPYRP